MKLLELEEIIQNFVKADNNPVVIYASIWPFIKALNLEAKSSPKILLDLLINTLGEKRSILMPTFANGYVEGKCNLDLEPSTTGVLSEHFRNLEQTKRTLSAFFSFNIMGPHASEVIDLRPVDAWGDDSVYHWMEQNNAHFIMLGIHPTHCSFLHRLEWLVRDQINYRYIKNFSGKVIRAGQEIELKENLFVRSLTPPVVNDFTTLTDSLIEGGLELCSLDGVSISHISAEQIMKSAFSALKEDPFLVLKNRVAYEHE